MKKRTISLFLSAVLVVTGLWTGAIPAEAAEAQTVPAEEQTAEWIETNEQDFEIALPDGVESLIANAAEQGESVSYGDQEDKAFDSLIDNLWKYDPEVTAEGEDGAAIDALSGPREKVTGIDPIMPNEGDIKTLVIIAGFEDYKYTDEFKAEIKARMFKDNTEGSKNDKDYPKESLRAYYQRASYGKLNIGGEFFEYDIPHKRSWYDNDAKDNGQLYEDLLDAWENEKTSEWNEILSDAEAKGTPVPDGAVPYGNTDVERLDNYLDEFDHDNDGRIDCVYFLCPGGNTGWNGQWWAYRVNSYNTVGNYSVPYVIQLVDAISERGVSGQDNVSDYLETYIHETGHQLGLDDYYTYESNDMNKTRTFAMMHGNNGDQDGFAKMLLGWLDAENIHWVTSDQEVSLRSFSENGDVALITLPDEKESHGIYSEFILAEYFTKTGNDSVTIPIYDYEAQKEIGNYPVPEKGFRFYHIYARLNDAGDSFLASNTLDKKLPLISGYRKPEDEECGFSIYQTGETLTPDTDPDTSFFDNYLSDGLYENTDLFDSGISITDLDAEAGTFKVSFSNETSQAPNLQKAVWKWNKTEGYYIECTFDRSVEPGGKGTAFLYDTFKDSEGNTQIDLKEKWGDVTEIRRELRSRYSTSSNKLYFMVNAGIYRDCPGGLVIPKGSIVSSKGIASDYIQMPVDYTADPKDGNPHIPDAELTVSVVENTTEQGQVQRVITVAGIPENTDVYYTIDGSEPNAQSTKYEAPIPVFTGKLKAVALDSDGYATTVRYSQEYDYRQLQVFYGSGLTDNLDVTLAPGEYLCTYPNIENQGSEIPVISYKSTDPTIAMVDHNGMIYTRKAGNAKIILTAKGFTEDQQAVCNITVTEDEAKTQGLKLLKDKLKDLYPSENVETKCRELATDLVGRELLSGLMSSSDFSGYWTGGVLPQAYTGKAVKPVINVYKGIKKLKEKTDYTITFKNNVNAGTAKIRIKPKEKGQKIIEDDFRIAPAALNTSVVLLPQSVKYTGKALKPKPVMIWKETGVRLPFSTKNFTLYYVDNSTGQEVSSITKEGTYTMNVEAKGANYSGYLQTMVTVTSKNMIEKLKLKFKTKSFQPAADSSGNIAEPVIPVFNTDYTITIPKGYFDGKDASDSTKPSSLEDLGLKATCYNNRVPGKMAFVIEPTAESEYAGAQIIYLTIRKPK